MTEKRKASGDAPGTSPPPTRMRATSTDGDDVSHGGDPGSDGERNRVEVEPLPQPQLMAGMDANLTDNSGRIDSFARAVNEEASSPSRNGEELAAAAGQPQPPPRPSYQPVEEVEPPQPLSNDERKDSGDAPGSSQPPAPGREDSTSDPPVEAVLGFIKLVRACGGVFPRARSTDGGSSSSDQEEVTSSLRPVPSSAQASPSRSEEQPAVAAQAQPSPATGHHVDQPAEADAPLASDDDSVASAESEMVVPAPGAEDSDHLGSP